MIFQFVAIGFMFILLAAVLGFAVHKRLKFRRAVASGSVPAEMLMSHWNVTPGERGDMEKFAFPVTRPAKREDIKEEGCPVCLGTTPKTVKWVIFSGCGHATCTSCFKKLASRYRLHAACPLCRKLLSTGEGDRGGKRKPSGQAQGQGQEATEGQTPEAAAAPTALLGSAPSPLPPQTAPVDTV
jgi:hypothetical protein